MAAETAAIYERALTGARNFCYGTIDDKWMVTREHSSVP